MLSMVINTRFLIGWFMATRLLLFLDSSMTVPVFDHGGHKKTITIPISNYDNGDINI